MRFLLLAVIILVPISVSACVCAGTQTVKQAFHESTAVFSGRVIAAEYRGGIKNEFAEMDAEYLGKKREYEVLVYTFEVIRWYKGGSYSTREVTIVTNDIRYLDDKTESVSDCDLAFNRSESYLIYAYGDKGELAAGLCSRTKRLARAKNDLIALETYRKKG